MVGQIAEEYNWGMSSYAAPTVRVYLLDDHDIVRQGLRDLLVPALDIEVVGDSAHASTAPDRILRLAPDVMLLDLQLQDGSGIEVCRTVRSADPSVRGLLLTSAGDDDALVATLLAGADGYVVKVAGTSDIAGAIRRVGTGRPMLDEDALGRARSLVRDRAAALTPALADVELDLLELMASGATDAVLARRLEATESDVRAAVAELARRIVSGSRPTTVPPGGSPSPGRHRRSS